MRNQSARKTSKIFSIWLDFLSDSWGVTKHVKKCPAPEIKQDNDQERETVKIEIIIVFIQPSREPEPKVCVQKYGIQLVLTRKGEPQIKCHSSQRS